MKKFFLLFVLLAFAACVFSDNAFGGAWTLKQYKVWGEYYFKWHWAKEDFGAGPMNQLRNKSNNGRSWGWAMEPKIEYGITDWLNFLCSLEYKESKYKEYDRPAAWGAFRRKNHGISSIKLGAKMRFIENPVVISGQFKFFIYPGYGNYNGEGGGFPHQPAIGDGDDALELRGLIGKEFHVPLWSEGNTIKCYAGLESGYRFRNRNVCNDIPFFVEGGFWMFDWLLVKAEVDGYWCHDGTGNLEKDYAIWRVGPMLAFLGGDPVTKQGKQFNVEFQYGQVFWGRNVSKDQELVLKVQTEF